MHTSASARRRRESPAAIAAAHAATNGRISAACAAAAAARSAAAATSAAAKRRARLSAAAFTADASILRNKKCRPPLPDIVAACKFWEHGEQTCARKKKNAEPQKKPLPPTSGARKSTRARRKTRRRGRSWGRTVPRQGARRERDWPPAMHSRARGARTQNGRGGANLSKLHSKKGLKQN
jgi:hypothetical protein